MQQTPECMLLITASIALGARIVAFFLLFCGHTADSAPI